MSSFISVPKCCYGQYPIAEQRLVSLQSFSIFSISIMCLPSMPFNFQDPRWLGFEVFNNEISHSLKQIHFEEFKITPFHIDSSCKVSSFSRRIGRSCTGLNLANGIYIIYVAIWNRHPSVRPGLISQQNSRSKQMEKSNTNSFYLMNSIKQFLEVGVKNDSIPLITRTDFPFSIH